MKYSKKIIKELYFQLLRINLVEKAIAGEYKNQEMRCPVHLCLGQEGIAAGVCANLRKSDIVYSNHRSHGHFLAKGGSLKAMIAEFYGKATGCSKGKGGSQHLIDLSVNYFGSIPVVGETIPLAVGSAFASVYRKEKALTAVFFGDAATEEGVFAESLNFAALKNLPILFVCENNFYSIDTPMDERQPKRPIFEYAKAFKMKAFQGDGNKVQEVYALAKKAVEFIRRGKGPIFLEFLTYRYLEHCGPSPEPAGYRPKAEISKWLKKDPVTLMEKYLLKHAISDRKEIQEMVDKIQYEVQEAFEFAKKSPFPKDDLRIEQVYAV